MIITTTEFFLMKVFSSQIFSHYQFIDRDCQQRKQKIGKLTKRFINLKRFLVIVM